MKKIFLNVLILLFCGNIFAQEVENNDTTIYTAVDTLAEFPGGVSELYRFIGMNLRYPQIAEGHVEGMVICKFVVEKDGSLTNIEVIRRLDTNLDKEAIRVIKLMPKWKPAQRNRRIVRSYFHLPIRFKLPE